LLPLILFALLVGLAGGSLPEREKTWVQNGLEATSQMMARIVRYALILAPYGVGALMAAVLMKLGLDFLRVLLFFVVVALAGMAIHLFGTIPLLLKLLSRRSPSEFFKAMRVVLATSFSTSSSNATLPTTLHVCRNDLGVSAPTAGFVVPLGATMNMAGTALFEGCVVLFVAQVYGIELSLFKQVALVLLAVVSAVAVAGIPGGSLPVIMGMLTSFGLPGEGIALVLGVDRILDMARTTLNVAADAMTACVVDEQVNRNVPAEPG
jgi:DAACS family dicarboxylate/amino acid:cation (Na+ or H+) symporter